MPDMRNATAPSQQLKRYTKTFPNLSDCRGAAFSVYLKISSAHNKYGCYKRWNDMLLSY